MHEVATLIVSCSPGMCAQVPKRYYFTRQVALGSHRSVIAQYGLPQRVYLGPTSMDTEMAFIMCNQAQVRCYNLLSSLIQSSTALAFRLNRHFSLACNQLGITLVDRCHTWHSLLAAPHFAPL